MVCVYATRLDLAWGAHSTRVILNNVRSWAIRAMKPRIWQCLNVIRLQRLDALAGGNRKPPKNAERKVRVKLPPVDAYEKESAYASHISKQEIPPTLHASGVASERQLNGEKAALSDESTSSIIRQDLSAESGTVPVGASSRSPADVVGPCQSTITAFHRSDSLVSVHHTTKLLDCSTPPAIDRTTSNSTLTSGTAEEPSSEGSKKAIKPQGLQNQQEIAEVYIRPNGGLHAPDPHSSCQHSSNSKTPVISTAVPRVGGAPGNSVRPADVENATRSRNHAGRPLASNARLRRALAARGAVEQNNEAHTSKPSSTTAYNGSCHEQT